MIRQGIKTEDYFDKYLVSGIEQIQRRKLMLLNGQVVTDRLNWFKKGQFDLMLNLTIANYTAGKSNEVVKENLLTAIEYLKDSWSSKVVLLNYEVVSYNQYTGSSYNQILIVLSLGYLLDINKADLKKIAVVIDQDNVKDFLFEFIIRAKIKDREPITEESYRDFFGIPKCLEKLRQAITETEKSKAEKLVKEFITKDWTKYQKELGGLENHKSKHDTYFGYWSFETAAIVKIMDLDDSSFRECQYYPKDLV